MFGRKKGEISAKKRLMIHETTHENDISYRGPLNYQHFKIFGWLCLVLAQIGVILALGGRINPELAQRNATWKAILEEVGNLALPFLLIANFAQILDNENGYRKQLLVNGAAALGVAAVFYLLCYRYIVGGLAALLVDPSDALPSVESMLSIVMPYGFLCFNLFVDMLLCSLTMFFLNYTPRHIFTGKWRICFRLLALLPIVYEVGCMMLKVYSAEGLVVIPAWAFPLLTVKPPMTFVLFVALALFVKTRELRFRRHGKTHEEYKAFLQTRRNSWNFSVFLAIMLVVVSLIDFGAVMLFSVGYTFEAVDTVNEFAQRMETGSTDQQAALEAPSAAPDGTVAPKRSSAAPTTAEPAQTGAAPAPREPEATAGPWPEGVTMEDFINIAVTSGVSISLAVGLGGSIYLFFLAPVVLLFSYTRKPKNRQLDLLIPVGGIVMILLVYLEGIHQLLPYLPFEKIDLKEFRTTVESYLTTLMEPSEPIK